MNNFFNLNIARNFFNHLDNFFYNNLIVDNFFFISWYFNKLINNFFNNLRNLNIKVLRNIYFDNLVLNHWNLHYPFYLSNLFLNNNFRNDSFYNLWNFDNFLYDSWNYYNFLNNFLNLNNFNLNSLR